MFAIERRLLVAQYSGILEVIVTDIYMKLHNFVGSMMSVMSVSLVWMTGPDQAKIIFMMVF